MSNKISFGLTPDDLQYIVSGIRNLTITINNKFFTQSRVDSDNNILLQNESHIDVECIAATSEDTAILQSAAISITPIYCKISSDKIHSLYGNFFVSQLSLENSENDVPKCAFKLQNSGSYEIKLHYTQCCRKVDRHAISSTRSTETSWL